MGEGGLVFVLELVAVGEDRLNCVLSCVADGEG